MACVPCVLEMSFMGACLVVSVYALMLLRCVCVTCLHCLTVAQSLYNWTHFSIIPSQFCCYHCSLDWCQTASFMLHGDCCILRFRPFYLLVLTLSDSRSILTYLIFIQWKVLKLFGRLFFKVILGRISLAFSSFHTVPFLVVSKNIGVFFN